MALNYYEYIYVRYKCRSTPCSMIPGIYLALNFRSTHSRGRERYPSFSTSYLIRALIPYHSHLLLLLNHVVIVVKLCCVEGIMEDRCTSNKHSR